jgi:N-acetylglucosamine kinase-like BadF-type ATPase
VLAIDDGGNIVFQGQSGAANLVSTPEVRIRKNLAHATHGCPAANYVCGCFAGLLSDDVRRRGVDLLRTLFPTAGVRAEPDYTAAFYASPEETDVCIICGTGSLVCSRQGDRIVKSGGRGYILGDYGSGYQFGRDALIQFLDYPREASESLRRAVIEQFQSEDEGDIVSAIYRSPTPAGVLAKLAKPLAADAREGYAYALRSIDNNLGLLLEIVRRHVSKHVNDKPTLVVSLTGGIWKSTPVFRDRFTYMLQETYPTRTVTVGRVNRPPLYGAVELAKEMIGMDYPNGH